MADDPTPAWDVDAALVELYKIAESTGKKVKDRLDEGLSPAVSHPAFLSFDSDSFKVESPDGTTNILQDVKEQFETIFRAQESKHFPSPGAINWRRVLLILAPTSFNENTYSSKPGDPWMLTLSVAEEDKSKIGRPFSLRENFRVKKGDIYLAYTVSRD